MKRNRFENGVASGSTVTISNSDDTGASAFSVVNGGPTYDNTRAMHGSFSAKFSNATTSQPDIVGLAETGATSFAAVGYFYLTGAPSAALQFGIRTQTTAAAQGEKAYIDTNRKLQIVNPAGTARITSTGTAMPLNQWIRWEFYGTGLNSASTVLTTAIYDADTGTAIDTLTTGTITTSTADCAEIRFGKNGAITIADWWLDDPTVNIGSGTPLGPQADLMTDVEAFTLDDNTTTLTVDDLTDTATMTEGAATVTKSGSGPVLPPKDRTRVMVDWDADGFVTGIDDVTEYVRGPITCAYGRSEPSAMSPVTAGSGSFALDNKPSPVTGARFSPRNTASPLFGKIKPGRPVLVERQIAGTVRTVFRGQTDSTPINPDVDTMLVSLQLIDVLATFRGKRVTTGVYQGVWPGDAIGYVLDVIGWTGPRDLERGATIFPLWWCDAADALDALQAIVASEGPPALLTMSASGAITFRGRHHRETEDRSLTPQATWRGEEDSPEPVMAPGFASDEAWGNVVNDCSLSIDEREIGLEQRVWETEDVISLEPDEGRTLVVQAADPFVDALAPREGIDYVLLAGSVEDVAISRVSGQSTSITITAGELGATLQGLALVAKPFPVARTYRITERDDPSALLYGELGLPESLTPVWANRHDAKSILQRVVRERKDPLTRLRVRFICGGNESDRLAAVMSYDLSDRIRVVEPVTATSADFFIEQIAHTMNWAGDHEVVFGLEAVPPATAAPFLLDSSVLGTGVLTL